MPGAASLGAVTVEIEGFPGRAPRMSDTSPVCTALAFLYVSSAVRGWSRRMYTCEGLQMNGGRTGPRQALRLCAG